MTLQSKLRQIGEAFAQVTDHCYHYWRPFKDVPCLIWAESGEEDSFYTNNHKSEQRIIGTIDLFTKMEFDPLADAVQETLDGLGLTWALNSVQYEEEINMIHMEWKWGVVNRGALEE